MKIIEISSFLEGLAPLDTQESYDNCGLIIGDPQADVTGILVCLDSTEDIIDEAIRKECNLVIAHHPLIFKGLKQITGKSYVERTVIKAIENKIAIYAIHTNLDNYRFGVNYEIGQRLGLKNLRILDPKSGTLNKLSVFVPVDYANGVTNAMFEAGGGKIGNYEECSFDVTGTGTFTPMIHSDPFIGEVGVHSRNLEKKVELLVDSSVLNQVVKAMNQVHPYEEVAFDIVSLSNKNTHRGSGMVGELKKPMEESAFLQLLKSTFNCEVIRHTALKGKSIKKVAFCGGSGSFLLAKAKSVHADVFVTGDYKYHDFFDAEGEIIIADIGHFESEQYTTNLLADILNKKFSTFAVHITGVNTNPINYF
jgi:dinuclear metal center YbgI/SA1388 family protein